MKKSDLFSLAPIAVCAALLVPPTAGAVGLITSVSAGGGTTFSVSAVNSTNVNNQSGALVTAFYSSPAPIPPETVAVAGTSAASGLGFWNLNIVGGSDYQLNAAAFPALTGISALEIDLLPAGGAFDFDGLLSPGAPAGGTPGSLLGIPPQMVSFTGIWDVSITFLNPIALGASPALGDLYGAVRIDFSSPFDANDAMDLRIDTDTLTGPVVVVPEPATLALFGIGILGLGVGARRRRR